VLARETQLRRHLGNALHVGLTPEQLVELIIHDTWYAGAPAGAERAGLVQRRVRKNAGSRSHRPESMIPLEDPDRLFARGAQLRMQYMGTPSTARPAPPTEAERAFNRITGEYYWGATWTRPGLNLPSRVLCTMNLPRGAGPGRLPAQPHPWGTAYRLHALSR